MSAAMLCYLLLTSWYLACATGVHPTVHIISSKKTTEFKDLPMYAVRSLGGGVWPGLRLHSWLWLAAVA